VAPSNDFSYLKELNSSDLLISKFFN